MSNNKKPGISIKRKSPWNLTEEDYEIIKSLKIEYPKISDQRIEELKQQIGNDKNNLIAYYTQTLADLQKQMAEVTTMFAQNHSGKMHRELDTLEQFGVKLLVFLFGSDYKDPKDRKLDGPNNGGKHSDKTQKEFMEFCENYYKNIYERYIESKDEKENEMAEEGVINELKLKMTFELYEKLIFENNVVEEE